MHLICLSSQWFLKQVYGCSAELVNCSGKQLTRLLLPPFLFTTLTPTSQFWPQFSLSSCKVRNSLRMPSLQEMIYPLHLHVLSTFVLRICSAIASPEMNHQTHTYTQQSIKQWTFIFTNLKFNSVICPLCPILDLKSVAFKKLKFAFSSVLIQDTFKSLEVQALPIVSMQHGFWPRYT